MCLWDAALSVTESEVALENDRTSDCIPVPFWEYFRVMPAFVFVGGGACVCPFVFCAIAERLASALTVVLQQSVCPFPQSFDVTMSCCDNEPRAPSQGEHHAVCLRLCHSSGATPIHTSAIHTLHSLCVGGNRWKRKGLSSVPWRLL